MDHLKKLGSRLLRLSVMTVIGVAYFALFFLPLFFTQDSWIIGIWITIVLLATMFGAIIHAIVKEKDSTLPYLERLKLSVPEATKKFFLGIAILVGIFITGSVLNDEDEPSVQPATYVAPSYVAPTYRPVPSAPVHYDSDYQYNYRTGNSGNYGYNYDIEGYSDSGDYFYGEIDTEGKYGEGYIYDDYGNEIYVETEWVGNGEIEAYDEEGNYYEFEVD